MTSGARHADAAGAPAGDSVPDFLRDLRQLRCAAGAPSYEQLQRRTRVPRSTLHDALTGTRLPRLEVVLPVVGALDGDEQAWRRRWTRLREAQEAGTVPAAEPGAGRWRPGRRTAVGLTAVAALVVAGTTTGVALAGRAASCTPVREYRASSAGAVLSADGRVLGRTRAGDTIRVRSLAHRAYSHRYYGTDLRTGDRGYFDEARLDFRAEDCV